MGKLLPQYQKAIIDDIITAINSNTSQYYAFAANPVAYVGNTPSVTSDNYSTNFINHWQLLFGKKLANGDLIPVILNNIWASNTAYSRYDNTVANLDNYYVVTPPTTIGSNYNIYKCIDNANGSPSIYVPDQVQATSFTKSDGYTWRYITSISSSIYNKTATNSYVPIISNTTISAGAYNYSGVEVVMINSGGSGYNCYANGTIPGNPVNTTLLQIQSSSSTDNDFYSKSGIYIYNTSSATSQLKTIQRYIANSLGNWVYLDSPANTDNIIPNVTKYYISPKVVFQTDADNPPSAISYINPSSNSISSIRILDTGYGVSWANVYIQSNTTYGTGANLYAIVPPSGGHGSNPQSELGVVGFVVSFNFANTESNTILGTTQYNKIGLMKNPYGLTATANTTTTNRTVIQKSTAYSSNTFSAVIRANVNPTSTIFTVGDTVVGQVSGALGTVAFSNATTVSLTGDKYFSNNERIVSSSGLISANIIINTFGNIYTKDISPIYVQNITNVTRSNTQAESFKLIIKV